MSQELLQLLESYGQKPEEEIHLVDCALTMAAINSPGISVERYQNHIKKLIKEVSNRHQLLLDKGADDNAATQLAALKHVIADSHGYAGDEETYDDLQNVNLMRVIDRRKGMPVALGLIYVHVGREQGWQLDSLSFPAHVVCRIEKNGERILFDPFKRCDVLQAWDLRLLLKTLVGEHAELSNSYYDSASNRELLIRMQNNIKLRQIEGEALYLLRQIKESLH